jgi:GcrA cell cycle regulator
MPTFWTREEDAQLEALWLNGYPTAVIADMLPGRNKNKIIGRAHRLGLPSRPSPVHQLYGPPTLKTHRQQIRAARVSAARAARQGEVPMRTLPPLKSLAMPLKLPSEPPPRAAKSRPVRVAMGARSAMAIPIQVAPAPAVSVSPWKHCQFPLTDGKPWVFCAEKPVVRAVDGKVICAAYCAKHYRVCYTPMNKEPRDLAPWVRAA